MPKKPTIEKFLVTSKFKKLLELGLINKIALRNFQIKQEFEELRKTNSINNSMLVLCKKYRLSDSKLNTILFTPPRTKSIL